MRHPEVKNQNGARRFTPPVARKNCRPMLRMRKMICTKPRHIYKNKEYHHFHAYYRIFYCGK